MELNSSVTARGRIRLLEKDIKLNKVAQTGKLQQLNYSLMTAEGIIIAIIKLF